jgi:hypothetical protein
VRVQIVEEAVLPPGEREGSERGELSRYAVKEYTELKHVMVGLD